MGIDPRQLSDERLGELIAAMNPVPQPPSDTPLTDRELEILGRIIGGSPVSSRPVAIRKRRSRALAHRRRTLRLIPAAVTVMVMIAGLVLAWPLIVPSPASALTPQPLQISGPARSLSEEIALSQELLRSGVDMEVAARRSHSVGWYLHRDHLSSGESTALISPEVVTMEWNPDGSGHERVIAAEPYWADGSTSPQGRSVPSPGTVLHDIDYPMGGLGPMLPGIPGNKAEEVRALLGAHWDPVLESDSASDLITAVSRTFRLWTLTNEQHAQILQLLSSAPGAQMAGSAVDRVGRDVTVIAADSTNNPNFRQLLLISRTTGRIVGVEDVRLTPLGDLPSGSVTSYTLWDTE